MSCLFEIYVDGLGRGNMDYWVEDSYIYNSVECVDMLIVYPCRWVVCVLI